MTAAARRVRFCRGVSDWITPHGVPIARSVGHGRAARHYLWRPTPDRTGWGWQPCTPDEFTTAIH